MPSPRTPSSPRRFILSFSAGNDPVTILATDRLAARHEMANRILRVRADLTYVEARKMIKGCRLHPEDRLKRGPKGPHSARRSPVDVNDHSVPQW